MKSTKNKILSSKIKDYKRDRKILTPPFGQINMSQIFWHKEMLPEFLWISSLMSYYGDIITASMHYNHLLDVLDEYHDGEPIFMGLISDFGLINEKDRKVILQKSKFVIEDAIINPFGNIIQLYPECPMSWLLKGNRLSDLNNEKTIEEVKKEVLKLYPAKDDHSGSVRALPLNRFFKHNKLYVTTQMMDLVEAIEKYPQGDRYHVESFARNIINGYFMEERKKNSKLADWSIYFWRYNFTISKCEI